MDVCVTHPDTLLIICQVLIQNNISIHLNYYYDKTWLNTNAV